MQNKNLSDSDELLLATKVTNLQNLYNKILTAKHDYDIELQNFKKKVDAEEINIKNNNEACKYYNAAKQL